MAERLIPDKASTLVDRLRAFAALDIDDVREHERDVIREAADVIELLYRELDIRQSVIDGLRFDVEAHRAWPEHCDCCGNPHV